MANSQRVGGKSGKKAPASATISKKRERRPVSHNSAVGSLTVMRHRMQNMRATRWNLNLAQMLFIGLGIVMVISFAFVGGGPNMRGADAGGGRGDVARVDKHVVERAQFEMAVRRMKDSPYAFMSGPTQELGTRSMLLDQQIDGLLRLDAARRERNKVGRKQLQDRSEQEVDGIIQGAKSRYKTDKDFKERFMQRRYKVSNEEDLRKRLRRDYITPDWRVAVSEQILVENLERKIRAQAGTRSLDKVKPEDVEVHARQILVKLEKRTDAQAKKLAEGILAEVKAGADFAKTAKAKSEDDVTKAKGGNMDWVAKGGFYQGPELEKAAFDTKPGNISGLVKTSAGYHILKVEGRRYSATKHWNEYVEGLKKKAKIEVFDPAILAYRQMTAEGKTPEDQKKNRQQALALFQKALDEPYDGSLRAGIYFNMGTVHSQESNVAKAAEMYGLAVNESPAPEIYMALGDAQRKLKKAQAAVASYKEASAMANDTSSQQHYFAHLMLQNAFKEMKETKLAAAEQAWVEEFMKQQQGGMGFPGGGFTVR